MLLHLGSFITFRPSTGSAVRIKKIRPKGKIVLKKRDQTEKNDTKKQKTASPGVEASLSARSSNSLTTAAQ